MKKILLLLLLPLTLFGQNTPAQNTTLINTEIRGKVYNNTRMANTLQALDHAAAHVIGVLVATGTDTYVLTANAGVVAYVLGQTFDVQIPNTNTGSATLNINALGAKTIKKQVTVNLSAGDLLANGIYRVAYDGTNFQLIGQSYTPWGLIPGTITDQTDLVNYIASQLDGLSWKESVVVRTTANITLSGEQTIDGVVTSADRILVANQTTTSANGIYVSAAGAWARATDSDTGAELEEAAVTVASGTSYANTTWVQTTDPVTLGTSPVLWSQLGTGLADGDKGEITLTLGATVWTIDNGVVTFVKMQDFSALSVLGRSVNSVGVPADIEAAADGQVLRRAANVLDFGGVDLADEDAVDNNLSVSHLGSGTNANAGTVLHGDATWKPGYPGNRFILKVNIATNYTPVLADSARTVIIMRLAAAQTFTIPTFASVAYKKGTAITIIPDSTNTITFVAPSGVAVETSAGDMLSHRQDAPIMLVNKSSNRWYLMNGTPGGTGSSSAGTRLRIISKTASHTLVVSDSNKTIAFKTITPNTLTIDNSVPFVIGTAITIVPDSTAVTTFTCTGCTIESSAGDLLSHGENIPLMIGKKTSGRWWLWNGTPGGTGGGTMTSVTAVLPITGGTSTTSITIGIQNAAADNTTKGASTYNPNHFNSTAGLIDIDFANGQTAGSGTRGYLSSADWTIFNAKAPTLNPTFTGAVTVPDTSPLASNDRAANTQYVDEAIAALGGAGSAWQTVGTTVVTNPTIDGDVNFSGNINAVSSDLNSFIILEDEHVEISAGDVSSSVWIAMTPTDITFDTGLPATFTGAIYTADYSANYVNRSLVDKGYVLGAKTFTGKQTFFTSTTGAASMTLPHGVAPTSPVNGDFWTTTAGAFARINGVTTSLGSAGGGGMSHTAGTNELLKGNGANAAGSGVYIPSNGNIDMGNSSLAGTSRIYAARGSATNVGLEFQPKGTGGFLVTSGTGDISLSTSTFLNFGTNSLSGSRSLRVLSSDANASLFLYAKGTGFFTAESNNSINLTNNAQSAGILIETVNNRMVLLGNGTFTGADGSSGSVAGKTMTVKGGDGWTTGNNAGGNVLIQAGTPNGSGTAANITIDSLTGYLIIATIPTSAAGLPSGAVWSNGGVLTIVP